MNDTGDVIMVIWVSSAKREQKPVYINDDLFGGTFRRNWEGDYHCTRLQVKTMLRDQLEETMDMEVLDEADIKDLNIDSVRGYRNSHKSLKPGYPFERLEDTEYFLDYRENSDTVIRWTDRLQSSSGELHYQYGFLWKIWRYHNQRG